MFREPLQRAIVIGLVAGALAACTPTRTVNGGGSGDGGLLATDGGLTDGGLTDGGLTDGGLTDGGNPNTDCLPPFVRQGNGACVSPNTPNACGPHATPCPNTVAHSTPTCSPRGVCGFQCQAPWVLSADGARCESANPCGPSHAQCPSDPNGTSYCDPTSGACYLDCIPPYVVQGAKCVHNDVTCAGSPRMCPDDPTNNGYATCDPQTGQCSFTCSLPDVVAADNSGCVVADLSPNGQTAWLALSQDNPRAIAYSAGTLYWVEDSWRGSVVSASLSGGTPVTVATGESLPQLLAVSGQQLAWYDEGTSALIVQNAIGGTPVTLASPSSVLALAMDSQSVYWSTSPSAGTGTIVRQTLAGSTPSTLATGLFSPNSLAVNGDSVFWTDHDGASTHGPSADFGTIQQAPLGGGSAVTLASAQWGAGSLHLDAQNLYWSNEGHLDASGLPISGSGAVVQLPIGGGTPLTLAGGQSSVTKIAVGSSTVAWCAAGVFSPTCSLVSVPIGGGAVSTLIANTSTPTDLVYAESSICYSVIGTAPAGGVPGFNGEIVRFTPN